MKIIYILIASFLFVSCSSNAVKNSSHQMLRLEKSLVRSIANQDGSNKSSLRNMEIYSGKEGGDEKLFMVVYNVRNKENGSLALRGKVFKYSGYEWSTIPEGTEEFLITHDLDRTEFSTDDFVTIPVEHASSDVVVVIPDKSLVKTCPVCKSTVVNTEIVSYSVRPKANLEGWTFLGVWGKFAIGDRKGGHYSTIWLESLNPRKQLNVVTLKDFINKEITIDGRTNLRSGYSAAHPITGSIRPGTTVKILETSVTPYFGEVWGLIKEVK